MSVNDAMWDRLKGESDDDVDSTSFVSSLRVASQECMLDTTYWKAWLTVSTPWGISL